MHRGCQPSALVGLVRSGAPTVHVLSQSGVDEGLVITAARRVDLILEPLEEVLVEADRDAGLSRGHRDDRSTPALAEVIARRRSIDPSTRPALPRAGHTRALPCQRSCADQSLSPVAVRGAAEH
jgi:hypothetical protein